MICVICNSGCNDSGLCEEHKYDEQIRSEQSTRIDESTLVERIKYYLDLVKASDNSGLAMVVAYHLIRDCDIFEKSEK